MAAMAPYVHRIGPQTRCSALRRTKPLKTYKFNLNEKGIVVLENARTNDVLCDATGVPWIILTYSPPHGKRRHASVVVMKQAEMYDGGRALQYSIDELQKEGWSVYIP